MKRIVIYHNPRCAKCRRIARTHRLFDWLSRIDVSTADPRTGPLQMGEIAVENLANGEILKGVEAVRMIARQVPAYLPLRAASYIPPIARYLDAQARGCADGSCEVPTQQP